MPEMAELIFHSELDWVQTVPGQLHRYQDVSVRAYLVATLSALAAPFHLLKLKIPLLSTLFTFTFKMLKQVKSSQIRML